MRRNACPSRGDANGYLQITIKRSERNKRKYVTSVHGLDYFGCDLKKVSKLFATKFATGSSVSKRADGQEEIQVQGDVTEEIVRHLVGMFRRVLTLRAG